MEAFVSGKQQLYQWYIMHVSITTYGFMNDGAKNYTVFTDFFTYA